ncbi:MAG: hypothetical protein OHK0046_43960 [Anaerolineae bacterium]
MTNLPAHLVGFNIQFANHNRARAVRVRHDHDVALALRALGLSELYPTIFLSGGASNMSDNDRRLVEIMVATIAEFAEQQEAIIVDGGTEAGIMNMIGEVRQERRYRFPLLGISPLGKISFPGYHNKMSDATLEDSHSHFILVDGDEWGMESEFILSTVSVLRGEDRLPGIGILVNGGKIAMQEVYLASTTTRRLPVIILEGSGRLADEISTAIRTGTASQLIIQAIVQGGDIQLVSTTDGPEKLRARLIQKFSRVS